MKLIVVIVIIVCIICGSTECDATAIELGILKTRDDTVIAGDCGENVRWVINKTSETLTINGTGDMYDYFCSSSSPDVNSTPPDWKYYRQYISTVEIGEGVTSIGNYSFCECDELKSVVLPQSIEEIGEYAFRECVKLQKIDIPFQVSSIGPGAFHGCVNLNTVTIQSNSISTFEEHMFYNCTSLTNVNIPSSVISIGRCTFQDCKSLTNIVIPSSVTIIGAYAFRGCNLTSIIIPSSVTVLGTSVFHDCTSLKSARILSPSITSFSYTFFGCIGLTTVNIPTSVQRIGVNTFYDCVSLTHIIIPSNVTMIDSNAFYHCSNLKTIVYHGSQEPNNTGPPFRGCSSIESIIVPSDYNSNQFCSLNINLCKSSSYDQINNCYEITDCGKPNETIRKRIMEYQSSGCFEYQCVNETGNIYISSTCNSDNEHKRICYNDECVDVDDINYVHVVIDIHPINVDELNTTDIQTIISSAIEVEANKTRIGVEMNEEGLIYRVVVIVDDEQTAKSISNIIDECLSHNSGKCNDFFRSITSARIVTKQHVLSGSFYTKPMMDVLFVIMVVTRVVWQQIQF